MSKQNSAEKPEDNNFVNISLQEYIKSRDENFDYFEFLRKDKNNKLIAYDKEKNFVKGYEQYLSKRNDAQVDLLSLVNRFFDLTKIFSTLGKFYSWFNESGSTPQAIAVNHPRELSHRCLDDLNSYKFEYGYAVGFENQTANRLVLSDKILWYGWVNYCLTPAIIEPLSMVFFDMCYSGVYNTAASCYRYKIEGTDWYAYIAFYSYRSGRNATYVELSTDNNLDWNTIYYKLTAQDSFSNPSGSGFILQSAINWEYKAKAVCQLAPGEYESYITKIKYMMNSWAMTDYHDEL